MASELTKFNVAALGHPQAAALMPQIMESVLMLGDLGKLRPEQRVEYYGAVCKSVGLNPLTKPFDYIVLNGKLTLYANKNCTDQLRLIHNISVEELSREILDDLLVTTAKVSNSAGRRDEDIGSVPIGTLKGEARANALMKCATKAKRRATLSICGLSMIDESEIESIQGARRVAVDIDTGQLLEEAKQIDTGGHPVGTQAAADAVAQRKIAEMQAARSKDFTMLKAFKDIKAKIGSDAYYKVLGVNGYAHSNEITDSSKGRSIYREMQEVLRDQQQRAAQEPEPEAQPAAAMASHADTDLWSEGRE